MVKEVIDTSDSTKKREKYSAFDYMFAKGEGLALVTETKRGGPNVQTKSIVEIFVYAVVTRPSH